MDADVIAGVDAVYSTPYRRTEDTARPIAEALDIPLNFYDAADTELIMEQIVRDARIAMLYEGTTGIQALDLLGRKVLGSGGQLLMGFTEVMGAFIDANDDDSVKEFIEPLAAYKDEWLGISLKIGERAMENPDEAGAASVDYLMYSGYVVLAYFWARMAVIAQQKISAGEGDTSFYEAKLMTARFYFGRLLPRTGAHKDALLSGADNLMAMPEAMFAF